MRRRPSLIIVLTALLCSCSKGPVGPIQNPAARPLTSAEQEIIASGNSFGFKLLQTVNSSDKDSNVFISPLSVSMALGMTLNGAHGATHDSMCNTLGLNGMTQEGINENFKSLMALLAGLDSKVIFQIANSIWYRQGFQVEQEFVTTNKTYFDAEVTGLDFSLPTASQTMNAWVDEKTNGKIQKIVPDHIDPLTRMYLINAIYFKGTWTYQFDSTKTKDTTFILSGGNQTTCRMMHIDGEFDYAENDRYQAVDLPYGDGSFSMTVLLPKTGADINSFIDELTKNSWQSLASDREKTEGDVYLPKFKLEYGKSLNDALRAMGMESAFDPQLADFTKINKDGGLCITDVEHKTFVSVDEEGTEAAAATSVEIGYTSVLQPQRFFMCVNHPFLFVIRDHHSQGLLFVGKIIRPRL